MKTNIFYLVLSMIMLLCGNISAQEVGDYGIVGGYFGVIDNWKVCVTAGTWDNATTATVAPSAETNLWIRSGKTLSGAGSCRTLNILPGATLEIVNPLRCDVSLTVHEGGILKSNNTDIRTITFGQGSSSASPYNCMLTNNGTVSSMTVLLHRNSPQLTITGSGTTTLNAIGQVSGDYSAAIFPEHKFVIDADVTINTSIGFSSGYSNGSNTRSLTINAGKTVTFASGAWLHKAPGASLASGYTESASYNINGTLDARNGSINLCTLIAASGTNPNQFVKMVIGPEGVVKCGSYVRLHGRYSTETSIRKAFVISEGTIEYSGTSYSTNQCNPGGTNGLSEIEITNSLLTPANNKNVIFTNPAGVTLTGDSTIFIKGNYSQAGNVSGKSITLSGTAQQTVSGGDKSLVDLIVNNTSAAGVVLTSPLTVNGTLTLTSGKVSLGNNDLTIANGGSISGASSSNYFVTDGAGVLTQSLEAATDKLYPIGVSATSYDPALINATTDATLSVKVGSALTGSANTGKAFNPIQWDITPASQTTATITLTPSSVTYSTNPFISSYSGSLWVDESLASAPYTGTYTIDGLTSFATGGSNGAATAIGAPAHQQAVTAKDQVLHIDGLQSGDIVNVYSATGLRSATEKAASGQLTIPVNNKGIYIVSIKSAGTESVQKVAVK